MIGPTNMMQMDVSRATRPLTLAMHHEVMVAKGKDGSSYLTGAKGMALYTFKKDTPVKSACAGDCVTNWPPYHKEKVGVTSHSRLRISRASPERTARSRDAALLLRARRRAGRHEGRRREGDLVAREAVRGAAERPRRDG